MSSGSTFTPKLHNNTDPTDFVIYTIEAANPVRLFATNWWGGFAQACLFGALTVSVSVFFHLRPANDFQ